MTKTIRLSDEQYEKVIEAKTELAKKGYDRLPDDVKKEVEDVGFFTLGAIASLGASALLEIIGRQ